MATMGLISLDLAAYLGGVMPPLDGELGELYKFASGQGLPIIGEDVLSFLRVIFVLKKPMRVLEIGCCVGFSALLMAREMGANGRVITIDRYPIMIEMAKENFSKLDKHGQIVLLEGDAAVVLPDLARRGEIFDLIFLDAAKGQYNRLWPWCERLLADGGVFLADDVLQGGTVAWDLEKIAKRQRTTHRNLNEFLQSAMSAKGYISTVLPIGDGLLVCVKG